jgi:hypothetical protein
MDVFAPYYKINGCFIVLNVSPQIKTITIFQYPINYHCSRDLLKIPGVAEQDIRASLLKGELQHKILAKDIIVTCSDIDLLQFNGNQKAFLQGAGIVNGLDVDFGELAPDVVDAIGGGGGGGITADEHETLRQLIHFINEGPGHGFATAAYKESLPAGSPFPTSIIWYLDSGFTLKLIEKDITYDVNQFPFIIEWKMYAVDGVTILHTVTDTISYTNAFESSRVRTIT